MGKSYLRIPEPTIEQIISVVEARERAEVLEDVLRSIPLRSDWDDDVKVTAQMVIDTMFENINEMKKALSSKEPL